MIPWVIPDMGPRPTTSTYRIIGKEFIVFPKIKKRAVSLNVKWWYQICLIDRVRYALKIFISTTPFWGTSEFRATEYIMPWINTKSSSYTFGNLKTCTTINIDTLSNCRHGTTPNNGYLQNYRKGIFVSFLRSKVEIVLM